MTTTNNNQYCQVWRRGSGNPLWRSIKKVSGVRFSKTFGRADEVNAMTANREARKWQEKVMIAMKWYAAWKSRQPKDVELPLAVGGSGEGLFTFAESHGKKLDFAAPAIYDAFMDEQRAKLLNKQSKSFERRRCVYRFIAERLPMNLPQNDAEWEALFLRIKQQIDSSTNANGTPTSPHTKNHYSQTLCAFTRFLWQKRVIAGEIRVLRDIAKRAPIIAEAKKSISTADLHALWAHASVDFRCYMALALNCAFYKIDLQDLTTDMVDFKTGRIVGRRGKTGVPFNFKLWPVTIHWMKKRLEIKAVNNDAREAQEDDLLFKSRFNGRITTIDTMFTALQQKALGYVRYSFSHFRDTSATIMEGSIDPMLTSYLLRHRVKGMKKFYCVSGTSPLLDAGMDRLMTFFLFLDYSEPPVRNNGDAIQRFNAQRKTKETK